MVGNNLGENKLGMKYIGDIMKQLPKNLHCLELYLSDNDIGGNDCDLKYIGEGMK